LAITISHTVNAASIVGIVSDDDVEAVLDLAYFEAGNFDCLLAAWHVDGERY